MKSARFSKVVAIAGKPQNHLLWTDPKQDKVFQKAVKAERLMTVHQATGKTKTDFGTVGYQKGASEQFLIFPRSLKQFVGIRIVGVKYDLVASPKISKADLVKPARDPKPKRQTPAKVSASKVHHHAEKKEEEEGEDQEPEREDESSSSSESEDIHDLKRQVKRAMHLLEKGKQVAAFKLLQRVAGD